MAETKKTEPAVPAEKSLTTSDIRDVMKQAVQEGVALGMAMAGSKPDPRMPPSLAIDKAGMSQGVECGECHQYRQACKGQHVQMVVFPKNRKFAKRGHGFIGVAVNGHIYRSNNGTHRITVPKENNILETLDRWEHNEEDLDQDTGVVRRTANLSPRRENNRRFNGY